MTEHPEGFTLEAVLGEGCCTLRSLYTARGQSCRSLPRLGRLDHERRLEAARACRLRPVWIDRRTRRTGAKAGRGAAALSRYVAAAAAQVRWAAARVRSCHSSARPRMWRRVALTIICHSRRWESAVCGALVGTLSNKKEFPTTSSSGEVADHREGGFLQD